MTWIDYAKTLKEQLDIVTEYIGQLDDDIKNGTMSPLARKILIHEKKWLEKLFNEYNGLLQFGEEKK